MFWEELYIRSPKRANNMFQILYKYLILNKQVSIPGVGLFQVVQVPARLDFTKQVIHSPVPTIKFTNTSSSADKSFFEFVAHELNIQEFDTIRKFHDFSHKLKNDVNTHKSIELPGIGLLTKNTLGELSFEPAALLNEYFPDTLAGTELTEEIHHPLPTDEELTSTFGSDINDDEIHVVKKERWWIAAIILAVIGIASIAYYYYLNSLEQ